MTYIGTTKKKKVGWFFLEVIFNSVTIKMASVVLNYYKSEMRIDWS